MFQSSSEEILLVRSWMVDIEQLDIDYKFIIAAIVNMDTNSGAKRVVECLQTCPHKNLVKACPLTIIKQ